MAAKAGKTLNPYQGLKRLGFRFSGARLVVCRKNPKSLSGIETDSIAC